MAITDQQLIDQAFDIRKKAYARYSGFHVGAAIEADNGKIYAGCNVENAAYPLGACAEVGAISAMIADGATKIIRIAIVGGPKDADDFGICSPCGGCRQRITEFADKNTTILLCGSAGTFTHYTINDLLPGSFALPSREDR